MADPLTRKPCPRCGREVAWRTLRGAGVNPGRYGAIPPLQQPIPHKRHGGDALNPRAEWCTSKATP